MSKNRFSQMLPRKNVICDDNEKLASGHQKNNLKSVMTNFKYLLKKGL